MNSILNSIQKDIQSSIDVKLRILEDEDLLFSISKVIEHIIGTFKGGNKVIFAGNGGSAADAQHLAAEFVSRFEFDRPGLPALSLSTDTSMITAIGNDYGYEALFKRQLEAQSRMGDTFIGITTSGKSKNILAALNACNRLNIKSVVLCGLGGDLESVADYVLRVPSNHTPRIQESHILIGHIICGAVERNLFGDRVE